MGTVTPVNGIPAPAGTGDGKDVVQDMADLANHIDTRLVSRYASESARNAANPSAIDGQWVYSADVQNFALRRNSDWFRQDMSITKMKTVNETVTSSTTLQNDNELFFYAQANATYHVELAIIVSGGLDTAGAAGWKSLWTTPAGSTDPFARTLALLGSTSAVRDNTDPTHTGYPLSVTLNFGTTTGACSHFQDFIITIGSTPGNVQFQWAQFTSNATAVTIFAGSTLTYTRLS